MSNRLIDLQHITKIFDGEKILDDLNLYIRENEFLTLLGPSGCGKTTTLRIIGGFLFPDEGSVIFDGKNITQLAPNKRHVEYRISEIRPLPEYERGRKHCLRSQDKKRKAKPILMTRSNMH